MEELVFELGKLVLKFELSKRQSPRLLRELGSAEQETILLQKVGKFWNRQSLWDRPDGLVLITTHRFVFLTKIETIATTTSFLSFPLEMIEGWEEARVWLFVPAVRFQVEGKPYMFTLVANSRELTRAFEQAKAGTQRLGAGAG